MLTVRVAFCSFFVFGAFEETFSWTIDLPQVRKFFFEKSFKDDVNNKLNNNQIEDKVVYDNIQTNSPQFNYEKFREHYADEYKYHGYMEQKVHDAVRNGSEYLEGLRRAIEEYTRKLEECRRMNVTANIIQLRPNLLNLTGVFSNVSNPTLSTNFTINLPPNATDVVPLTTTFANFMNMSANFTVLNVSEEFRECMRADRASEHVRRLAQLAIWAASELQDKFYSDTYDKRQHDDSKVLRLAWFLDRLARLTGFDPRPQDFVTTESIANLLAAPRPPLPPGAPAPSWVATVMSTAQLTALLDCISGDSSRPAPARCALPRNEGRQDTYMSRGWPGPPKYPTDLSLSSSENHEYTYTDQDYAEENMPLSLPQRAVTNDKARRKRSVQEDPLQDLFKYYAKYKAWTGSNLEIEDDDPRKNSDSNSILPADHSQPKKREKRFIVKKKYQYLKPENPTQDLSSYVKHKLGIHYNKDKEEASKIKKLWQKLNVKHPAKTNLKKHKSKRSVKYMKKFQPRVPLNPYMDISYYVKNKKGTNYDYNVAQAARVRVGLEEIFQNGNIEVVRRYGSNYNPANRQQILAGYARGFEDV